MKSFGLVLLLAVAAAAAPSALAQGPRLPERLALVSRSLKPGDFVRVQTAGRSVRVGFFRASSDSTLALEGPQAGAPIRLADVAEVSLRRNAVKRGAAYGGIAGAVLGGAFLGYLSYAICDAAMCAVSVPAAALGALFGGGAGAVAGAVVGSLSSRWERVYP